MLNIEDRQMLAAHDARAVTRQELIRAMVQWQRVMWADIEVAENLVCFTYHKHAEGVNAYAPSELFCRAVRDRVELR